MVYIDKNGDFQKKHSKRDFFVYQINIDGIDPSWVSSDADFKGENIPYQIPPFECPFFGNRQIFNKKNMTLKMSKLLNLNHYKCDYVTNMHLFNSLYKKIMGKE